jgi:mediator of replication checkpoint protein 1
LRKCFQNSNSLKIILLKSRLYRDKERKQDEAAVSKLLKDITTGALRRKRGVGDELDLSDEEEEAARRREAKRREFARMRRELLKDEAVGKIAEDKKKEAFLKSIEDREAADGEDDLDLDITETPKGDSQSQPPAQYGSADPAITEAHALSTNSNKRKQPLEPSAADILNRLPPALRHTNTKVVPVNRKPSTIAEIRESVSFLIEEPDSQSATPQYGSSDDEDADPEAYVNLDRHLQAVDGNEEDEEDLGDFIVDDSQDSDVFKKPQLPPPRAPFAERRTKANVVDRRSLLRQASSSSSATSKMAFFTSKAGSSDSLAFKGPSLLRRATTNSSLGSVNSANVSATGVSVATERGAPDQEKEVIRKGAGSRRNAVNFRVKPKEERMKSRITAKKGKATKAGKSGGFLGGLFGGNSWD